MQTQRFILIAALVVVALGTGFYMGRATDIGSASFEAMTYTRGDIDGQTNTTTDEQGRKNGSTSAAAQSGATIRTSDLSDSQRKLLAAFGISADNITITPTMVACAEAKLGVARIEEIEAGASPSFSEGASLVACYRE